jgi:tetratricopeptide (TPR) repeat protein
LEILILQLLFWIINHGPIDRTKRVNTAIEQAEQSLQQKDYANAGRQFRYLVDSLRFTEPAARLALAHSLFEGKDTLSARQQYQRLDSVPDIPVRSAALQQLGVLAGNRNENEQALAYFKQTLKADPNNEDARYDYELLKKKLNKEQQKEEQKKNPNDQEPSDFAKRLKAQAEALVLERRYQEAHTLMRDGLKKDKTVSAFNEFINRIHKVAQINK